MEHINKPLHWDRFYSIVNGPNGAARCDIPMKKQVIQRGRK